MGTIKVDTITPLATNSEVTIASNKFVGTAAGTMTVVGEGGTNQTNLQQGLTKVWVTFDGTASGATERDSFNVSSTDDDNTGLYGVNFTTNMGNANFPGLAQRGVLTGGETTGTANCNRMTTSSIDKIQAFDDSGSLGDRDNITCHVTGDLA